MGRHLTTRDLSIRRSYATEEMSKFLTYISTTFTNGIFIVSGGNRLPKLWSELLTVPTSLRGTDCSAWSCCLHVLGWRAPVTDSCFTPWSCYFFTKGFTLWMALVEFTGYHWPWTINCHTWRVSDVVWKMERMADQWARYKGRAVDLLTSICS